MAIPSTGLFRIYPANAQIVSGNFALSSAPKVVTTDVAIGNYLRSQISNPAISPCALDAQEVPAASGVFVPLPATYELLCSPDTTAIVFDTTGVNETIAFLSRDFPTGCTMNQMRVWIKGSIVSGPSRNIFTSNVKLKFFGSTVKDYTPVPAATVGFLFSDQIITFLTNWSPIQTFKPFGISFTISGTLSALLSHPQVRIDQFYVEGVYNTGNFEFTLDTPNAGPGDVVQITDAQGRLDTFQDFYVYWDTLEGEEDINSEIPGFTGGIIIPWFITRTDNVIRFVLPPNQGLPYGGRRLMIAGATDGIVFVGQIPIANINVLLADGSGVYQLTKDKRNDTYYDRSTTPTSEIDLKIPDPRFRTGYF